MCSVKANIKMIEFFILFFVVISGILNLCAARFLTMERQVPVFIFISSFYSLILSAVLVCFSVLKSFWFY